MADAPVFLLGQHIVQNTVLGVQVGVDVQLTHVVDQIKVEIVHPALFQLLLKDLLYLIHVCQVVAREFIRQIKALPGILSQDLPHGSFRVASMVAPGGVVVVHPVGHGPGGHLGRRRGVHCGIVPILYGQAHTAHAQGGQFQILKSFVDHCNSSLY